MEQDFHGVFHKLQTLSKIIIDNTIFTNHVLYKKSRSYGMNIPCSISQLCKIFLNNLYQKDIVLKCFGEDLRMF